jgi:hypothetical protein
MPVYEFECPRGHVIEDVVPMSTTQWPCHACISLTREATVAKRILSATPTTFVHADTNRRMKMVKQIAGKGR